MPIANTPKASRWVSSGGLLVDWSKGNGFYNTQEELDADDFTYGLLSIR